MRRKISFMIRMDAERVVSAARGELSRRIFAAIRCQWRECAGRSVGDILWGMHGATNADLEFMRCGACRGAAGGRARRGADWRGDRDPTGIGARRNRTITDCDPTAHAEIVALREAARRIGNHRCGGSSIYVTVEPCAMCAGASSRRASARLIYGARRAEGRRGAFCFAVFELPALNHRVEVTAGVLAAGARRSYLRTFFALAEVVSEWGTFHLIESAVGDERRVIRRRLALWCRRPRARRIPRMSTKPVGDSRRKTRRTGRTARHARRSSTNPAGTRQSHFAVDRAVQVTGYRAVTTRIKIRTTRTTTATTRSVGNEAWVRSDRRSRRIHHHERSCSEGRAARTSSN